MSASTDGRCMKQPRPPSLFQTTPAAQAARQSPGGPISARLFFSFVQRPSGVMLDDFQRTRKAEP
jgi:hypothetical protein